MSTGRQALRQRRERQGLTQESAAFALHVAVSTYRSWENGTKTPRVGFRPRLAKMLDVTLAEIDAYLDGNGAAVPKGHAVPAWLGHLASLEQAASAIRAFEATAVHGLLQTEDYATAVERAHEAVRSDDDIVRSVQTRMARQAVLARRPNPLGLSVILDESVLHRVAGGPDVMASQLEHLVEASERANIDIRILPLDANMFVFGSFALLASPDGDDAPFMAITEDRAGPHYHDRPHETEVHAALFEHLLKVALTPSETTELIRTTAKERYL